MAGAEGVAGCQRIAFGETDKPMVLVAFAVMAALVGLPMMEGRATYYAEPYIGRAMKNGDVYTGEQLTTAVPWQMWDQWREKQFLVCGEGECIVVKVTDTCRCREACRGIILDLSRKAFNQLVPLEQGVIDVRVWEW